MTVETGDGQGRLTVTAESTPHTEHGIDAHVASEPGAELARPGVEPLLTELRHNPHGGPQLPAPGVPARPMDEIVPAAHRRRTALALPTTSEPEVLRHFGRLAHRTFNLQQGLYPLGSCTMKYNPAVNEALVQLDGFAQIHPLQPDDTVQGALRLLYETEDWLKK